MEALVTSVDKRAAYNMGFCNSWAGRSNNQRHIPALVRAGRATLGISS